MNHKKAGSLDYAAGVLFIVLFVIILDGCDDGLDNFAGSCQQAGFDVCWDFTGSGYTKENVEAGCAGFYFSTRCPSENRVGRCIMLKDTMMEYIISYYPPTYDAVDA